MAWTSPATWVAAAQLTAAQLNQQLRDNLLELNGTTSVWSAYTPVLSAGSTPATFTRQVGRYKQIGKTVAVQVDLITSATGTSGQWKLTLPVAPHILTAGTPTATSLGVIFRVSAASVRVVAELLVDASGVSCGLVDAGASVFLNGAIASGDALQGQFTYEAA